MNFPKLIRIAGVLALVFAVLGFFGNFVQWRNAKESTAKIVNAEKQWARGGAGHMNLDIEYSVDGKPYSGTAAMSALQDGQDEIKVLYMANKPERVIPVDVIKTKRRDTFIAGIAGIVLTGLGFALRSSKQRSGDADGLNSV